MRSSTSVRFVVSFVLASLIGIAEARACDCPCDEDSDCSAGEVCQLETGECIDPDGPCDDDSDCGGGQLCNPDTGNCEHPTDECTTDADCIDGSFCNGTETCDRFAGCLPGEEVFCDDGSDVCLGGVCDEEIQGCTPIAQNDGEACGNYEGDACVVSAVCEAGACVVEPLCDTLCERCDPAGCASLCGNPFGVENDLLNSTDALYALRASVELEACELCVCDVNGDGIVTASDVLLILRKAVGLGDTFSCLPTP
jgi:hypothetical protein